MITMNNDSITEIYVEIPSLIKSIDDVAAGIVSVDGKYAEQAGTFLQKTLELFPKIIRSYSYDQLISYASDVVYWKELLNKIIQAFNSVDRYKMVDVLYFEAKQSILEYKTLLEKLELV